MSRAAVGRWIASGRLVPVFHGVYALAYRRPDPHSTAQAALLAAGERTALARETAAGLWGINDSWPSKPQLIGAVWVAVRGIDYRQSRTLLTRDVTVRDGLRVTSAARTILDIAPSLSSKRLTRAIDGLRVRRLVTTGQLKDVTERNPQHPGAKALKAELRIGQREPTRSDLEIAFREMIGTYKLPVPRINVHVGGHRVDAFFPEHQLVVELDGWATHQTPAAFERDRRQDAEILALTGIPTVRFTYDQTLCETAETAARLRTILQARGRERTDHRPSDSCRWLEHRGTL